MKRDPVMISGRRIPHRKDGMCLIRRAALLFNLSRRWTMGREKVCRSFARSLPCEGSIFVRNRIASAGLKYRKCSLPYEMENAKVKRISPFLPLFCFHCVRTIWRNKRCELEFLIRVAVYAMI